MAVVYRQSESLQVPFAAMVELRKERRQRATRRRAAAAPPLCAAHWSRTLLIQEMAGLTCTTAAPWRKGERLPPIARAGVAMAKDAAIVPARCLCGSRLHATVSDDGASACKLRAAPGWRAAAAVKAPSDVSTVLVLAA